MTTRSGNDPESQVYDPSLEEGEEFSDRPSYLPETVDFQSIPPTLKAETAYWTTGKGQVLSEEAAQALMEAEGLLLNLHKGDTLQTMGLNPYGPGYKSLRGHCTRVAVLSLLIHDQLQRLGSPVVADTRVLAASALFHDIGKLDPEVNRVIMSNQRYEKGSHEWETITQHPRIGAELALAMPWQGSSGERLKVADAIYKHHERSDGTGYMKLPASKISSEASIIAIADTIDAMGERRSYKNPIATTQIMNELERCNGKFNPHILAAIRRIRSMSGIFVRHRNDRG